MPYRLALAVDSGQPRATYVDELHLLVYPLTVGSGKRVVPEGLHATFGLRSASPYPTGVVGLHYVLQRGTA